MSDKTVSDDFAYGYFSSAMDAIAEMERRIVELSSMSETDRFADLHRGQAEGLREAIEILRRNQT